MAPHPEVRIALLGAGRIASLVHAPVLARLSHARIVALADADPAARDRAGVPLPGAVRYADWRRALDVADLDAVVVCLPPALHAPAAVAAFERGLHIYVEKPLALDLAEADAMIAAWREAGTVGAVGFNFRFHPLVEDAARRLRNGDLGRLLAVRSLFTSARRALPGWKADPRAGGGALADLATHHVDLIGFLARQPFDIATLAVDQRRGPEGALALLAARLADGVPVQMAVAQTTGHSVNRLEFLGEKGHLTVDLSDALPRPIETPPGRLARLRRLQERLRPLAPRALIAAPGHDPSFGRALAAFVAAARECRPASPDLDDGRRTLAVVTAAEATAPDAELRAAE